MLKCKKHKEITPMQNHHRNASGECANCVFFSNKNCGKHIADNFEGFTA